MAKSSWQIGPNRVLVNRLAQQGGKVASAFLRNSRKFDSAPSSIGKRTPRRCATPPFERPASRLKREIYELACDIHDHDAVALVESFVRDRDRKVSVIHRPRDGSAVYWAIRLVMRSQVVLGPKKEDHPGPHFDGTTASRLGIELDFAFRHRLVPQVVPMFIDHFGGYEIISAKEVAGRYDFSEAEWITPLQWPRQSQTGNPLMDANISSDDEEWR